MPITKKKTSKTTATQELAKKEVAIKEAHQEKEALKKTVKATCKKETSVKTTVKKTTRSKKATVPSIKTKTGLSKEDVKKLLDFVVEKLDEGKAEEIITISLAGKSSFTDYLVIANGTSSRHLFGLMNNLVQDVKKAGYNVRVSGEEGAGNWIVIDLIDVVVHLFTQEARCFYDLEGMWQSK